MDKFFKELVESLAIFLTVGPLSLQAVAAKYETVKPEDKATMTNWFAQSTEITSPIFTSICHQDFIKQLTDGTLDIARFNFYIQQDALYLSVYKKLLANIGSRCDDNEESEFYLTSATDVIAVEKALHQTYCTTFEADMSPTCELYTSYLAKVVFSESLPVAMAAVLPCFTIYKAVGDYILAQNTVKDNPYQMWIDTYGGEAFAMSTARAVEITNKHAAMANTETLEKMNQTFIKASKLEWMFWESAYKQEQWRI